MKTLFTAAMLFVLPVCAQAQKTEPTHKFTWDNLLAASIKLQKNYNFEANVDSYMQRYQSDVWNYVRNDEFELAAQRKKSTEEFRNHVRDFSLDRNIVINTWLDVGNYNFETESFPIRDIGEGYFWHKYQYTNGSFPRKFELYLINHDLLSTIPMSPKDAQAFLQRRNSRGFVNRRLDVKLYIRVVKLRRPSKYELLGEVQLARVYRDEKQNLILRDITKPVEKASENAAAVAVSDDNEAKDE